MLKSHHHLYKCFNLLPTHPDIAIPQNVLFHPIRTTALDENFVEMLFLSPMSVVPAIVVATFALFPRRSRFWLVGAETLALLRDVPSCCRSLFRRSAYW